MKTPIVEFVKRYADGGSLRLHMPGHKGLDVLGAEHLDITEIAGADVLYGASGIIRDSEENASALFGTEKTLYSTEGSSLSIRGMLYLALLWGKDQGRMPLIFAARNAHKVFMTAAGLLNFEIEWLYPEEGSGCLSCPIAPDTLDLALRSAERLPAAVYITSPDYLGNLADVRGLAEVCHRYGVWLLVDNAHGAYLNFLPEALHPISLGADLCCDSAHKTLPVLTGGGYLHLSYRVPRELLAQAERAMALFASTSPSYLILQSLDLANRYLAEGYGERLTAFAARVAVLRSEMISYGYSLIGDEPLKLTVAPKSFGYTGTELGARLAERGIVCEFCDRDFCVMMLTPEIGIEGLDALRQVLTEIPRRNAICEPMPVLGRGERVLSIREALFSLGRELPVADCVGRVLASASVSCPPAIPIVVCGERIDEAAARAMEYYGVERCVVIEE